MKKYILLFSLILNVAQAAPLTTKPNVSNLIAQCLANVPVVGNGAGVSPICHASGALGVLAFTTPGTGVATALGNNLNSNGGIMSPTPTRAGDIAYWTGSVWATLAGNNSGTNCFSENASGVPAWATCSGGTGSPGGSNTQVQYNAAGSFGGITGATSNGTTLTLVAPILGTPASGTLTNTTGFPIANLANAGTGVLTALGVNIGSAGAPILFNGAGGTPSSMAGTNITGTAAGLTSGNVTTNANLTGMVTSVGNAASLGSFTSANLATALTDETGSGANVFGTAPTISSPVINTAATLGFLTGSTQCLQVNTSGVISGTGAVCGGAGSTGANPTATGSDTAVNGVATTFMRSDGAPAVQKASNAQFGLMEGDTTTITCTAGVCSATTTAWTSYTPTMSCGTGTLTTAAATGAYKQIGKTVFIRWVASITTNGTCAVSLRVTLPVAPLSGVDMMIPVRDIGTSVTGGARINSGLGSLALMTLYNGGYLGGDASSIVGTGVYEAN